MPSIVRSKNDRNLLTPESIKQAALNKIETMKGSLRSWMLVLLLIIPAISCDKNDDPAHPNEHVNNWIYDNLKFWYYWTNDIPSDPDRTLEHEAFFKSLLSPQDKFSWIQDNFQDLLNSLQGVSKEAGYEIVLYKENDASNNVIAQVLYVKKNSPAEAAGVKRGDLITKINDQTLTLDNYKTLLDAIGESHTVALRALDINARSFGTAQTVPLVPVEYSENPHYLDKVFTYDNRRVGYYVYNFFATGPTASSTEYSNQMDQIFSTFQGQGITDLIIDLRFNSGGAESAARNLASLIGKDISTSKFFVKHQYNDGVTAAIKKEPTLGESFLNVPFLSKAQNVGSLLHDGRVYILTGSRTASASELIVNALKPFMDVFLIGNKTVGKNLGSISLYDKEDPENKWGMQPIVTKSFNDLNQSDYDTGFNPQILDADNSLYIYPLGDANERLLSLALHEITGAPVAGRLRADEIAGEAVGHSLDLKRRSGVLVVEQQPIR